MSGEVVAVGSQVRGFAPGDAVMSQANGCYAEYVAVDHRLVLRIPEGMSWESAAAVPVTFVTAHDALVSAAKMRSGESVLVQAITSAIGISAIQVAKIMGAGTIIGTTVEPGKNEKLRDLGLDEPIDVSSDNSFAQRVLHATRDTGVDVVADTIGAGALDQNLRCTALEGRIVSIGRMGGFTDTIDLDLLALRRIKLIGVTFRTRTIEQKKAVNDAFLLDLGDHLSSGRLRPIIDKTFALSDAAAAQEYMRSGNHFGKIVLLP
jgi:NADPH:quinone reductase-like Zn-dependent oxidoreductase